MAHRQRTRTRTRSATNELGAFPAPPFLAPFTPFTSFTPADAPPAPHLPYAPAKSASSPHLVMHADPESDDDSDGALYTVWRAPPPRTPSLRTRLFTLAAPTAAVPHRAPKPISTAPDRPETETETDEPPRRLPTARAPPTRAGLSPLLFECSRLLSIVPAIFGTVHNIYYVQLPPKPTPAIPHPPHRLDYIVSTLWAILTGYQCLRFTTGLLTRWRLYYPPLPTLIRLLALQAICWPATHLALKLLHHEARPAAVWALIGSTTSVSRSVQMWVTSNLWWDRAGGTERHWDWDEVVRKCILPAAAVYVVMAWAGVLRRELEGC